MESFGNLFISFIDSCREFVNGTWHSYWREEKLKNHKLENTFSIVPEVGKQTQNL